MPDSPFIQRELDGVEACLERIRLAWNAGDAHAFAGQFTEDATYVIYLGEALLGRADIEKNQVQVLGKWERGTKMAIKAVCIHRLDEHTASVLTVGGIGKGDTIPYDKLQTFTMTRRNDQWMCTAFQNTAMSRRAKHLDNPDAIGVFARLLCVAGGRAK